MPKRPDFIPHQDANGRWKLSIPPSMTASGKRVRKFFPDETSADKYAASMRAAHNKGLRGAVIPATLANEAMQAAKLLEPHGIGLMEAARMAAAALADKAGAETFRERWKRAVDAGEKHWSARYARDMGKMNKWLPKWFLDTKCGMIRREMVDDALRECGAKARSTLDARGLRVMAVVNYRERHRKISTPEIMTRQQVAAMLRACESPDERRAVALIVFAGIRPDADDGEISRLDWETVKKSEIYVPEGVAKTRTDRHIPIKPRLARLLRGYPKSGPVVPANWPRVYRRLRKAAGIEGKQDVTRHTFASHYLAAYGEHAAKQAMGHTANSSTIFRHYRRAVTEEDGKRFFR